MLTISKPTLFSPDGLATRGQCNHDSPGWMLRWFEGQGGPVTIWQGAFKTCRHLQASCAKAVSLEEALGAVKELLSANAATPFANQPTDAYPTPARVEISPGAADSRQTGAPPPPSSRRKRKKRRH